MNDWVADGPRAAGNRYDRDGMRIIGKKLKRDHDSRGRGKPLPTPATDDGRCPDLSGCPKCDGFAPVTDDFVCDHPAPSTDDGRCQRKRCGELWGESCVIGPKDLCVRCGWNPVDREFHPDAPKLRHAPAPDAEVVSKEICEGKYTVYVLLPAEVPDEDVHEVSVAVGAALQKLGAAFARGERR